MIRTYARQIRTLQKVVRPDPATHVRQWDKNFLINENPDYFYRPVPTARNFHASDSLVRCVVGPYGSSKTTMMLSEILFRTLQMPKDSNGVRTARWAIIRNTYGELETTTYVSWMTWFAELGKVHRNKKPILTVRHEFNDKDGPIELEVLFLALDKESDIRKLKSLEIVGCYINEASEIPYAIFDHLKGRVGRFRLNKLPSYWKGIILDTNPPPHNHWLPELFERTKPPEHQIFHQPSGLIRDKDGNWQANLEADNIERLGNQYYLNMTYGATEEFVRVYCLGEYGSVYTGRKVFPEYNDDLHSADEIRFDPELPVYIGMDFGLTPSAVFVQRDTLGCILVCGEITTEQLGTRQFIENVLTPFISENLRDYEIAARYGS